jgi:hypothetical protein
MSGALLLHLGCRRPTLSVSEQIYRAGMVGSGERGWVPLYSHVGSIVSFDKHSIYHVFQIVLVTIVIPSYLLLAPLS